MFDGLKDMGKLMKQAKEMKSKMKDVQKNLKKLIVVGTSLNDQVVVEMTGELDVVSLKVVDELWDAGNKDKILKAIVNATNNAAEKSKAEASKQLSAVSGDFNLPGM